MLQQAIIDATALKEAAVRNAETLVLEKYSNQIKDAVEMLLEQEEDQAADLEGLGDDTAQQADAEAQESEVLDDIPIASLAENPDEEIEIPLKNLMEEIDKMISMSQDVEEEQLDVIAEELENMLLEEEEVAEDVVELEEDDALEEALAALEEDLIDEALLEELLEEEELEEDEKTNETGCGKHEGIEEDLDQLEEALVVDIKPTKRGLAGRPDSDIELAEEELLALEQDSEYREKMAAMRKAVSKLEGLNESLTQENETLKQQLNEVKTQMSKIRNVANTLKENIDQTNLTNAKLLYQNKALNSDSMNERQKNKLVEALNNAETVEEAKVIFDTLENTVGSTSRKSQPKSLVEAVEKSSSIVYASRKQRIAEQKQPPAYDRWKFLAGIDKK